MDEDVIVIDNRNAAPRPIWLGGPKTTAARPPVIVHGGQPPVYVQSAQPATYVQGAAPGAAVYVRDPATGALVRETAGGATATAPTGLNRLGKGELIDLGIQILAVMLPLPGAPAPSGDVAKDVRNDTLYQGALALAEKRERQLRTVGTLVGKLIA